MAINARQLSSYVDNGLNVFISGHRGTAKSQLTKLAVKNTGKKFAYFSAPTFDPYIEVMGVPVPRIEEGKAAVLEFARVARMEDVEVIILDEINRASTETQNMIFEVIDEGNVNGSRLGNLSSVIAMVNPNDSTYIGVSDLDPALLDRFDVFLETDIKADPTYMNRKFGTKVGRALVAWHNAHLQSTGRSTDNDYISPRRLDKICTNWMIVKSEDMIKDSLPPGVSAATRALHQSLITATTETAPTTRRNSNVVASETAGDGRIPNAPVSSMKKNTIDASTGRIRIMNRIYDYNHMDDTTIRVNSTKIKEAYHTAKQDGDEASAFAAIDLIFAGVYRNLSYKNIVAHADWAIIGSSPAQASVFMSRMTHSKKDELRRNLRNNGDFTVSVSDKFI